MNDMPRDQVSQDQSIQSQISQGQSTQNQVSQGQSIQNQSIREGTAGNQAPRKSSGGFNLIMVLLTATVVGVAIWFMVRMFSASEAVDLRETAELSKGDIVRFGKFEQDSDSSNGAEEIDWIVLDVQPVDDEGSGMKALLMSRDVLLAIPLHNVYEDITWDKCSLRAWLNDEFYSEAFDEEEQARVLLSENANHANPSFEPHGCADTKDKVFILSLEEAKAYLRTEEDRSVIGSADASRYAVIKHLETEEEGSENAGKACWWLRTPGVYQYSAAFVDRDGSIFENGAIANHETYCGVRPVVWVKIGPEGKTGEN